MDCESCAVILTIHLPTSYGLRWFFSAVYHGCKLPSFLLSLDFLFFLILWCNSLAHRDQIGLDWIGLGWMGVGEWRSVCGLIFPCLLPILLFIFLYLLPFIILI